MSEPNSGQWGKQDSGGSATPSVAHAADGAGPTVEAERSRGPSDSGAAHSPPHAFGTSLAQPLTELQRNVASIARHFAKQQDGIYKALNSVKFPDFKAGTTQLSALSYELAKPSTELQRVMTSVASHFADRQDGWQNLLNDIESEFTAPPIEDNDHTIREREGIQDNLQRVHLAPKLEMIREWIVSIVIIATFIVMLINTVSESDDAVIINIDEMIMNVCEPCDQISYRDLIRNRND